MKVKKVTHYYWLLEFDLKWLLNDIPSHWPPSGEFIFGLDYKLLFVPMFVKSEVLIMYNYHHYNSYFQSLRKTCSDWVCFGSRGLGSSLCRPQGDQRRCSGKSFTISCISISDFIPILYSSINSMVQENSKICIGSLEIAKSSNVKFTEFIKYYFAIKNFSFHYVPHYVFW